MARKIKGPHKGPKMATGGAVAHELLMRRCVFMFTRHDGSAQPTKSQNKNRSEYTP